MQPNPPVGGTPLLPPSYLTVYFIFFLIFLTILYIYFYRKKRPVRLFQKVKLFLVIALVLKITLIAGIGLLAAYWLIPTPGIRRTTQADKLEIVFDRPVRRAVMEKSITPDTPGQWVFENSIYTTHLYRNLVFYPTYSLHPGTTYTVKLSNIRNLLDISPAYDYQYSFTTPSSPKVLAVMPVSGQHEVNTNQKITVTLTNANNNISEFDFQLTPKADFDVSLDSSKKIYTLTPRPTLAEGVEYNLKILKSDVIYNYSNKSVIERGAASLEYDGSFTVSGNAPAAPVEPAKITLISPENGWTAVSVHSPITITFDKIPDQQTVEDNFSITPKVDGDFNWNGNLLVFTPRRALDYSTTYTVTDSNSELTSVFTTQDPTMKLSVPAYLQKYTLSCEAAALRMALNYRGANVTEDDLIPKIGTDSTPHTGNIWGNPNNAFVGNIKGNQMVDGYGTYWGPIARVANEYRKAEAFQGWNIQQLTGAISAGNPVVIWVYSHFGTVTSWNTPDGTSIYAVRDEHAVVAVGFVGSANDPTQIIINDPLSGQVYWSRASFDSKWNIFGRSGVVVY